MKIEPTYKIKLAPSDVLPRQSVINFAVEMEKILRKNDHKGGWNGLHVSNCISRMYDEMRELNKAYKERDNKFESRIAIQSEAVDVANFAMMLFEAADAGKM